MQGCIWCAHKKGIYHSTWVKVVIEYVTLCQEFLNISHVFLHKWKAGCTCSHVFLHVFYKAAKTEAAKTGLSTYLFTQPGVGVKFDWESSTFAQVNNKNSDFR